MLPGIWEEFLAIVKQEAGSQVVETWLKAVALEQWDALNKVAHVKAPNSFVRDWVKNNYLKLFELHLSRLLNVSDLKVNFFIGQQKPESFDQEQQKQTNNLQVEYDTKAASKNKLIIPGKLPVPVGNGLQVAKKEHASLNASYCFENFVIGPSNSLAHAAAWAVAEKPGRLYNPLFIYGSSGLGKTHLLHAIGNKIKALDPNKTVVYQTADRFVNEFISAIRFNRMFAFREKYKMVDVLLIDDIQFIANKDQTQEAFFHIFNSLYDAHKQIIFSSDCYPKDLKGITERLRSRMESGLVTDIYIPTIETKIAILKKKAEQSKENLSDDVAFFIANQANANIRQLEGCLIRVIAFAHLTGQTITKALAERVLGVITDPDMSNLTLNKIAQAVASNYSYTIDQLRSKQRGRDLSFVRQLVMYLTKKLTDRSLREIGQFLNRKDHSTVLHAINKIESMVQRDIKLQKEVGAIRKELGV